MQTGSYPHSTSASVLRKKLFLFLVGGVLIAIVGTIIAVVIINSSPSKNLSQTTGGSQRGTSVEVDKTTIKNILDNIKKVGTANEQDLSTGIGEDEEDRFAELTSEQVEHIAKEYKAAGKSAQAKALADFHKQSQVNMTNRALRDVKDGSLDISKLEKRKKQVISDVLKNDPNSIPEREVAEQVLQDLNQPSPPSSANGETTPPRTNSSNRNRNPQSTSRGNGKGPATSTNTTRNQLDNQNVTDDEENGNGDLESEGGESILTSIPTCDDLVKFMEDHSSCDLGDLDKANLLTSLTAYSEDKQALDALPHSLKSPIERMIEKLKKRQQIIDILCLKKLPLEYKDELFLKHSDLEKASQELALTERQIKTIKLIADVNDHLDKINKDKTFKDLYDSYNSREFLPKIFGEENFDILFGLCNENVKSKLPSMRNDFLKAQEVDELCRSEPISITMENENDLQWALDNQFYKSDVKSKLEMLLSHIQLAKLALNKCSLKDLEDSNDDKHKDAWREFKKIKEDLSKFTIQRDESVKKAIQRLIDDLKLKKKLEKILNKSRNSSDTFSDTEKEVCTDEVLSRAHELGLSDYKLSDLYKLARNGVSPAEMTTFNSTNSKLLKYLRHSISGDCKFDKLTDEIRQQIDSLEKVFLLEKEDFSKFQEVKYKIVVADALDRLDKTTYQLDESEGISKKDIEDAQFDSFFNGEQQKKAKQIIDNISNMQSLVWKYSDLIKYLKKHPQPVLKDFAETYCCQELLAMKSQDIRMLFPSDYSKVEDLKSLVKARRDALSLLYVSDLEDMIIESAHPGSKVLLETVLQDAEKYGLNDEQKGKIDHAYKKSFDCAKLKHRVFKGLDKYCASKADRDGKSLQIIFEQCKLVCGVDNLSPSFKYTVPTFILLELGEKLNRKEVSLNNIYTVMNKAAKEVTSIPAEEVDLDLLKNLFIKSEKEIAEQMALSSMTGEQQNLIKAALEQFASGVLLTDIKYKEPLELARNSPLNSEKIQNALKCFDSDKKPLFESTYRNFLSNPSQESFKLLDSLYPKVKKSGTDQGTFIEYVFNNIKVKPVKEQKSFLNVVKFLGTKSQAHLDNFAKEMWSKVKDENVEKIVQYWKKRDSEYRVWEHREEHNDYLDALHTLAEYLGIIGKDEETIGSHKVKLVGDESAISGILKKYEIEIHRMEFFNDILNTVTTLDNQKINDKLMEADRRGYFDHPDFFKLLKSWLMDKFETNQLDQHVVDILNSCHGKIRHAIVYSPFLKRNFGFQIVSHTLQSLIEYLQAEKIEVVIKDLSEKVIDVLSSLNKATYIKLVQETKEKFNANFANDKDLEKNILKLIDRHIKVNIKDLSPTKILEQVEALRATFGNDKLSPYLKKIKSIDDVKVAKDLANLESLIRIAKEMKDDDTKEIYCSISSVQTLLFKLVKQERDKLDEAKTLAEAFNTYQRAIDGEDRLYVLYFDVDKEEKPFKLTFNAEPKSIKFVEDEFHNQYCFQVLELKSGVQYDYEFEKGKKGKNKKILRDTLKVD